MSLAGRVSAFFLGTLALVLVAFGVSLYVLTATYFERRADEDRRLHRHRRCRCHNRNRHRGCRWRMVRMRSACKLVHKVIRRPRAGKLHLALAHHRAGRSKFVVVPLHRLAIDQVGNIQHHFAALR